MNIPEWLSLTITIICAAAFAVAFYYRVHGNVLGVVSELIAQAEKTGLTGPEKMEQVVDGLMTIVPVSLRKILTKERLEMIAQHIFDWMRSYANEYNKSKNDTPIDDFDSDIVADDTLIDEFESPEEEKPNIEDVASLITELFGMNVETLKKKAEEYEAEIDSQATKKMIVETIIKTILNKAQTGVDLHPDVSVTTGSVVPLQTETDKAE